MDETRDYTAWEADAPEGRTVCGQCKGPAYRQHSIAYPHEPRGPWLHLNREDWIDNPHNVVTDKPAEGR